MKTLSFWAWFLLVALLVDSLAGQVTDDPDDSAKSANSKYQEVSDKDGDRIPDRHLKIPALDDEVYHTKDVIAKIGKIHGKKKFKTRVYERFEGKTNKELRKFLGVVGNPKEEERKAEMRGRRTKRQTYPYPPNFSAYTYPTNYDITWKWPQCAKVMTKIQDQGMCGSCWAVASAAVITDRRCIYFNATTLIRTSAWDMVSCCKSCSSNGNGCDGGWPYQAFSWYATTGVVSGGSYSSIGTSTAYCKPYPRSPTQPSATSTPCSTTCQPNYTLRTYPVDKRRGQNYFYISYDDKAVMWELMNRGPVVAIMDVYKDFYSYSSGVYRHLTGDFEGGHAVKLVGWGVDSDGTKFWRAANSWGSDWGEDGHFRILRGTYECNIDYYHATAGIVKN